LVRIHENVDALFVASVAAIQVAIGATTVQIPSARISFVLRRLPSALELFTNNGFSFYLEFEEGDVPESLPVGDETVVQKSDFASFVAEMGITQSWRDAQITNFRGKVLQQS
jgi:hypothetical protein